MIPWIKKKKNTKKTQKKKPQQQNKPPTKPPQHAHNHIKSNCSYLKHLVFKSWTSLLAQKSVKMYAHSCYGWHMSRNTKFKQPLNATLLKTKPKQKLQSELGVLQIFWVNLKIYLITVYNELHIQ